MPHYELDVCHPLANAIPSDGEFICDGFSVLDEQTLSAKRMIVNATKWDPADVAGSVERFRAVAMDPLATPGLISFKRECYAITDTWKRAGMTVQLLIGGAQPHAPGESPFDPLRDRVAFRSFAEQKMVAELFEAALC